MEPVFWVFARGATTFCRSIIEMTRSALALATALLPTVRSLALPPRLQHVFDLAVSCGNDVLSVADIGTDHGLLASELTKHFQSVIGVDKSEHALQGGALSRDNAGRNVDFRVGNGLQTLRRGEADVVCIAGMGVHTMCEILDPHSLETIDTQHLVLQPTNSRPKHLMLLYEFVEGHGWSVEDECILYTQGRWYITTRFDRSHPFSSYKRSSLPGSILTTKASMYPEFSNYKDHHVQWIGQDKRHTGKMSDADRRWLEILPRQ